MKKLFLGFTGLTLSTLAVGQNAVPTPPLPPELLSDTKSKLSVHEANLVQTIIPLCAIALLVFLLIQLTKYLLDYKLKNKIIDRGISEQLAASILGKNASDKKEESIKWALILFGLSLGLTLAYVTRPLHIHSLSFMALSVGISYLIYFYYLKQSNK